MITRPTLPGREGSRNFVFVIRLLFGSFLLVVSGIFLHFGGYGQGEEKKGGFIVTPDTHPFRFWGMICGLAMAGVNEARQPLIGVE